MRDITFISVDYFKLIKREELECIQKLTTEQICGQKYNLKKFVGKYAIQDDIQILVQRHAFTSMQHILLCSLT